MINTNKDLEPLSEIHITVNRIAQEELLKRDRMGFHVSPYDYDTLEKYLH